MKYIFLVATFLISSLSYTQWNYIPSGVTADLDAIHFVDGQIGYVSGGFTNTLTTSDGGDSWNLGTQQGFRDFSFTNNLDGYGASIVSMSMAKSVDGGNSWTSLTPPTSNSLWAVSTTSSNEAHFVGTGGVYWYTTNGGTNVFSGTSGTTSLLTDIVFTSQTVGLIVVQTGEIRRSTSAGASWAPVDTISGGLLTELCMVNSNIGYVVGSGGRVSKTTDGGLSWDSLSTNSTSYLQGVDFYDENNGIVVGTGGTVLFTVDGGDNWLTQQTDTIAQFNDVRMLSATSAVVIGDAGIIMKNENLNTIGLQETDIKLNVYPNPSINILNFESNQTIEKIIVKDSQGKTVIRTTLSGPLNISELKSGMYFVEVEINGEKFLKKIIKEN